MLIADLHADTVYRALGHGLRSIPRSHLDLMRMKNASYALQVFAAFIDSARTDAPWERCLSLISCLTDEIQKNSDLAAPVLSGCNIEKNISDGKISVLISVEEGDIIEGKIERIAELHSLGVRMMTLTWNHRNSLACPAFDAEADAPALIDDESSGLTALGREAIEAAEEKRIILDVSHLSDRAFFELADISRRPFIASHSNSRAIHPVPRNLTDEMIRRIANAGGIIGLNCYANFIGGQGGFCELARHARHIADIGGVSVLALGSDFDGIPNNPLIPDCKSMPFFEEHLGRAGFSDDEIDLIMGKNALRFLSENL